MNLLNFKPNFHVEILDFERVVLFSEDQHYLLQGPIYSTIAEIFKLGSISEEELLKNVSKKFPIDLANKALERLKKKNFVINQPFESQKSNLAFWAEIGLETYFQRDLSFVICNFSQQDSYELLIAMETLELTVKEHGEFFVVLVDNYICRELEKFTVERSVDKKPWILIKPSGRVVWIGPIFEAGKTGCWNCLLQRLKENRRVEVDLFGIQNHQLNIPSIPSLQTTINIAFNLAANELAKWIRSKGSCSLNHNLLTFDLGNLETRFHPFKSLNVCNICHPENKGRSSQPLFFKSSLKNYFSNEGERTCSLEETFQNIKEVVSPVTGVVSSMRHSVINGEHVCYTIRNLPLPLNSEDNFSNRYFRIPDVATGKGKTKLQATVGCIAEAIERYNCTFSDHTEIRCCYDDIKDNAIHPDELLNFSETQYKNREEINNQRVGFNRIPKRYCNSEIGWTLVYEITENRFQYVPSSYCYLYYPFEDDLEICPGNSNGCAGGNSLEEATFYAILELVERDAVAIWWYNRLKKPSVNLDSLNDSTLNHLQEKFMKENREFIILDLTTDLNIPCYAAVTWKSDGSQIFFGTGAHLQPRMGIARAISELNQVMIRSNVPKNIDLNSIPTFERELVRWFIKENIKDHPYLIPEGKCILKSAPNTQDFLLDINFCLDIFKKNRLKVFLFDLTNPDIQLNTIRVIIPGLRHFWSRLGPGRLYDIPVKMGWIKDPLPESLMNPIPYFL